jgi:hypothetical protein
MAGLDPAIHHLCEMMDARVIRAFTPVFEERGGREPI